MSDKDALKIASKGVSRHTNKYKYEQYKDVLYQNMTYDAINYSIRHHQGQMKSLKCTKRGLVGVHVKNHIEDDRVSTVPHKRQRMNI